MVEEFASELATVIRRFVRLEIWKDTRRIVLGGGLIASCIGELAMGRASILLMGVGVDIELCPIKNHPDEAGLIGAVQLAPSWILAGHDAILAADIGGTNVRVGVVELNADKRGSVAEADVWKRQHWRHLDDKPARDDAIDRIAGMMKKLPSSRAARMCRATGKARTSTWQRRWPSACRRSADLTCFIQIHNDAVVQGLTRPRPK